MSDRTIRESIAYMAGTHQVDAVVLIDVEVDSLDTDSMTCQGTALTGPVGNAIADIRLMAAVDDGVLLTPSVGSTVTVIMSTFTGPVALCYSAVDKITLLGGDLGGLVKVIDLTKKLNNLENIVNDLIAKFNTHTHNVTAVSAPTGPNLLPETQTLIITKRIDIENQNITQG